jgi:competence protein ComEA
MLLKGSACFRAATLFACLALLSCFPACNQAIPIEISTPNPTSVFTGSIFIAGAVNNPGLYLFRQQDTLGDLVQAAGGLKDGATFSQVILTIPGSGSTASPQRININTADAWLLGALPGIGDTYAKNIVAYREQNGPFRTVNDLLKIKGIGPTILDRIKDLITVS